MRVIAGKYKSRKLEAPPGMQTRPTSDRLRETLFNVVAPQIDDSVWLDVFAGSGAMGIEALSRGARTAYFVESASAAARIIRKNLHTLEINEGAEVISVMLLSRCACWIPRPWRVTLFSLIRRTARWATMSRYWDFFRSRNCWPLIAK